MGDLSRFVAAQDRDGTYTRALQELRDGRKTSHWMWFVFPQLAGLGRSATAQHFAIASLDEAVAYLRHPVLGARLREAAQVLAQATGTATEILGEVDALKLRSSMTLFARAAAADGDEDARTLFARVLERCFDGREDGETLRRL